ncbi:hypothetical protein [Zooshikella harenae]|uniref:N-acetyltransferase n=1 Tax=Zooshikella harenae TaxID=2827238 RepID=A0ABS5Z7A4_9GAMM|nr:hypothetical protein [Zooshikella harenae]MBU2709929.1 hypothetical protein [Zooshikella harenae]
MYSKFQLLVHELGWLNAFLYSIHRGINKLHRRCRIIKYYLYSQPISTKALLPESRGKQFIIQEITASDQQHWPDFPCPERVVHYRFNQHARCFAAYKNNQFQGYIWYTPGTYQEDEVRCFFEPLPSKTSVWDFDVYIVPHARMSLAFPKLWDTLCAHHRSNNVKWTLSRISAFNKESICAHERLGAKRVGSATFICVGKCQLMLSSHAPWIYISFKQGPRLRVSAS